MNVNSSFNKSIFLYTALTIPSFISFSRFFKLQFVPNCFNAVKLFKANSNLFLSLFISFNLSYNSMKNIDPSNFLPSSASVKDFR